jgi:hypothetical protein
VLVEEVTDSTAAKREPLDGENVKKFLVPRKKARVASQPGMGHSEYIFLALFLEFVITN